MKYPLAPRLLAYGLDAAKPVLRRNIDGDFEPLLFETSYVASIVDPEGILPDRLERRIVGISGVDVSYVRAIQIDDDDPDIAYGVLLTFYAETPGAPYHTASVHAVLTSEQAEDVGEGMTLPEQLLSEIATALTRGGLSAVRQESREATDDPDDDRLLYIMTFRRSDHLAAEGALDLWGFKP